jgi:hypothetical protein
MSSDSDRETLESRWLALTREAMPAAAPVNGVFRCEC